MKQLLYIFFLLFSGCDLFNSGEEFEEPSFEYITATINGKDVVTKEPRGGIFNYAVLDDGKVLQVNGYVQENKMAPHLFYVVAFQIIYSDSVSHYSVIPTGEAFYSGGRITEWDYDVMTGRYFAFDDGEEHEITVFRDQTPEGREYLYGEFSYTVAVAEPSHHPLRQLPDTVRVTNGKYRILLD
jgi:hypothetical protein